MLERLEIETLDFGIDIFRPLCFANISSNLKAFNAYGSVLDSSTFRQVTDRCGNQLEELKLHIHPDNDQEALTQLMESLHRWGREYLLIRCVFLPA